jgi:hypothetical protein
MLLTIQLKDLELQFEILDNPLAQLWLDRMSQRHQWTLDHPERFYGFNPRDQDEQTALNKINACIHQVQARFPEHNRGPVMDCADQDSLNYWHHVFETRHGFLEQEDRSDPVTAVLADLNVAVHRCESVARGNRPRFVCTWYGMPKTNTLTTELMQQYGTLNPAFGSVCLNYCEIGKTLEDLTQDRDNYISDSAFRPFNHYSADFNVRMHEETVAYAAEKLVRMQEYYRHHRDFFFEQGYTTFQDPRMLPLRFPVAQLVETMSRDQLLEQIRQRQTVTQVTIQ